MVESMVRGEKMKDFPMFTTDFGVASLILKEVPYQGCSYIIIRDALQPEELTSRLELLTKVEEYRPSCLRCGAKLTFGNVQSLDNSPMRDSIFQDTFDVQPAYCESCGKIEFYHPHYVNQNKFIAYLIDKDTSQ